MIRLSRIGRYVTRATCVALVALLALVCAGCAPERVTEFSPAGKPGEEAIFDVVRADGVVVSRSHETLRAEGDAFAFVEMRTGQKQSEKTTWFDGKLDFLRYESSTGAKASRVPGSREVRGEGPGQVERFTACEGCVENAISLFALRGAKRPAPGERTTFDVLNAPLGVALPARVKNAGEEEVAAPEGKVRATHYELSFLTQVHDVWIDGANRVVRYHNPNGTSLALVGYRASSDAPEIAPLPDVPPPPPPAMRIDRLLFAGICQLLMIAAPFVLMFRLKRRWGLAHRVWGIGALAFVVSQVVHIPFNWAIGLLGAPRGASLLSLPMMSVVAGLSAGVCESLARYAFLRWWVKTPGDRAAALMGAGHGGIEASIIGLLGASSTLSMALFALFGPERIGVPADQVGAVQGAMAVYFTTPLWQFGSALTERCGAVAFHVLANVMVGRAVDRRAPGWLLGAIALHATIDGGLACIGIVELGHAVVAVGIVVVGVACWLATRHLLRGTAEASP